MYLIELINILKFVDDFNFVMVIIIFRDLIDFFFFIVLIMGVGIFMFVLIFFGSGWLIKIEYCDFF